MRGLRAAAAGLALAMVAFACGDTATTTTPVPAPAATTAPPSPSTTVAAPAGTSTTAAPTTTTNFVPAGPRPGGEAVIALDMEPPTLNPYAPGGDLFSVSVVGQLHQVGIADVDASLTRVPEVLEVLPAVANGGVRVNEDGTMTVRYVIREEARWADGVPISGADFAFTLETLAATPAASLPWPLGDDNPYQAVVAGSAVAGAKSFEFTMAAPTLLHEEMFATILPAHEVAGTDLLTDWDDRIWVEGGPFRFEEWVPGESMSFVRNDEYWKTDAETGLALPHLDRVVVRFIPETQVLVRAFADRDVDVIEPPPDPFFADELRSHEDDGARLEIRNSPIWEHFNFQFGENNPNAGSLNRHVEFRRAVAHAIDRDVIAALPLFAGTRTALGSYLDVYDPAVGGSGWDRYPHDPAVARGLLAGLCADLARDCVADPPRLVFATTSNTDVRPAIGRALDEMLGDVGIEVELDFQDSQQFFGTVLDAGAWDMGLWAWVGQPGHAALLTVHELFDPGGPPPAGSNFYRWGTPAVTEAENPDFVQGPSLVSDEHTARYAEILDAMRATVDGSEMVELARQAEDLLADQVAIIPLMARGSWLAVWADELGAVAHNPSQAAFTWNVEEWYRLDR